MVSDSLDIKCIHNGENVDCSKPSIPGTKLKPKCKVTHSLQNGQVETPIELICLPDGKWSGGLYNCVPCNYRILNQQIVPKRFVSKFSRRSFHDFRVVYLTRLLYFTA